MDQTLAVFIVALLVLALIAFLLIRAQNRNSGAQATVTLGDFFTAEVKLEPTNTESAGDAIQQAARERGEPPPPDVAAVAPTLTRLARVLWVDDNPDNNLYETIALERLGRFVIKTTSTEAAERYLDALNVDMIITDLGRGPNSQAGHDLIRRVRAGGRTLPIIVYTLNAEPKRNALISMGADAVVDLPYDLVREVNAHLPCQRRRMMPARRGSGGRRLQ